MSVRLARAPEGDGPPAWVRLRGRVTAAVVALAAAGLVAGGLGERPSNAELGSGATAARLTTASSNRYEYWRVGLDAFARKPLTGLGSGGFRVEWLRERQIPEGTKDVHSLELEMAAELGLVGLLAFGLLAGGIAVAGVRAVRAQPEVAAGAGAGTLVWALHASIDWDWQLPAVTLPAIALAGALLVISEAGR